jgi:uncharacterized protein YecA (UPF0149 family)
MQNEQDNTEKILASEYNGFINNTQYKAALSERIKAGPTAVVVHHGGTLIKPKAPARNAPCPCGSGKKYKQCCIK